MPRKPDRRFRPETPKPPRPLPTVPTVEMVDAALTAACRATGERQGDVRLKPADSPAALYAYGALYDLFTAAPDAIAKRIGVTGRDGWMVLASGSRKLRASPDWRGDFAGFVARQLGIAVDKWRRDEDDKATKRAASEQARVERRRVERQAQREAAEAHAAAEAREDLARREAALASTREIERASQEAAEACKSRLTPRVYVKMREDVPRVAPGLRTARARDDWWNGEDVRKGQVREARRVFEVPGMPPKGRSALEMKERGE